MQDARPCHRLPLAPLVTGCPRSLPSALNIWSDTWVEYMTKEWQPQDGPGSARILRAPSSATKRALIEAAPQPGLPNSGVVIRVRPCVLTPRSPLCVCSFRFSLVSVVKLEIGSTAATTPPYSYSKYSSTVRRAKNQSTSRPISD